MTRTDEFTRLKSQYRAYNANCRLLIEAMQDLEETLTEIYGVKAVSWDKIGRKESLSSYSRVIALMPKKDGRQEKCAALMLDIQAVEQSLDKMVISDKNIVKEYYIDEIKQSELAEKYNTTQKNIERTINRAIRSTI